MGKFFINIELAKEWVKKAEEDYEGAVTLVKKSGKATPDIVCFLSQQCAEKYLKAFLVLHDQNFSRIHDLLKLLTDCIKIDGSFEFIHDLLRQLSPYAVAFRYPGEESTKHEAKLAFKCITEFRQFIRTKIRA